ncbi:unnamed protein product [Ceratitis capitata]|uniref:(Mediterranean fruit fly) hypothetical protein n=1 Tax=Ceratitis capitata TaxID=7213 RepID=A0A811U0J0_CERCA|nr:unnamed protein product [Ceratitis capitata]
MFWYLQFLFSFGFDKRPTVRRDAGWLRLSEWQVVLGYRCRLRCCLLLMCPLAVSKLMAYSITIASSNNAHLRQRASSSFLLLLVFSFFWSFFLLLFSPLRLKQEIKDTTRIYVLVLVGVCMSVCMLDLLRCLNESVTISYTR